MPEILERNGFDTIIQNGTLITRDGPENVSVAIRGGVVAAIDPPRWSTSEHRIDATGQVLLPGLVDPHSHFWDPGATHREDWLHGTRSALAGGVTTVIEMPLSLPPTVDVAGLDQKISRVEESAVADAAIWGGVVPAPPDELSARMRALRSRGITAFKVFMCEAAEEFPPCGLDDLSRVLELAAALDVMVGVHAEDPATVHAAENRLRAEGRSDPLAFAASRTEDAELAAVSDAIDRATAASAKLYIVHMSAPAAIDRLAAARTEGLHGYAETCPHYLTLDTSDLEQFGPYAKCAPPLRSQSSVDELWDLVLAGTVDTIGSDHAPFSADEKRAGETDIWAAPNGLTGLQTMLPLLIDEGIHRRGLDWALLARLTATNAADIFGLPSKGRIEVGADADIVFVDPEAVWTVRGTNLLSIAQWTPYEGRRLRGRIIRTLLRGEIVYEDGRVLAAPGSGQLLNVHPSGDPLDPDATTGSQP